jgi:hypothetical protein
MARLPRHLLQRLLRLCGFLLHRIGHTLCALGCVMAKLFPSYAQMVR